MTQHNSDKPESDNASALAALAEDIISLMLREHQKIQQELSSIRQLIDDASGTLMTSLEQISNGIDDLIANPAASGTRDHFNQNFSDVVTALQFDDIVQQISQQSQKRTQHIQNLFVELSSQLDELKASAFEYSPSFDARLQQLRDDIRQLDAELQKESPACQARLAEGKIELF